MTKAPRIRIVRRVLASALRVVFLLVVLLLLSIVFVLKTGPGRGLIRTVAEAAVSDILPGRITIDRVAKIGLTEVRLEGVTVFDTSGRRVIAVRSLNAEPNLRAIIGGVIELTQIDVLEPEVTVIFDADGQPSLVGAFAAPPDPSEEPKPPGEPTIVALESITLVDGVVHSDDPSFQGMSIEDLDVQVALRITDQIGVELDNLALTVVTADDQLVRLDPLEATFDTTGGVESFASLTLSNAADQIDGQFVVTMPMDESPLALQGTLQLDPLTSSLLEPLGFGDLLGTVPEWVRGEIAFEGTLDELHASISLQTNGGPISLSAQVYEFSRVDVALGVEGMSLADVAPALPELFVATGLEATWAMLDDGAMRVELQTEPTRIDDYRFPSIQLEATFDGERVTIEQLDVPDLGSGLSVTGSVGVDGSADVTIRTAGLSLDDDPNFSALVPDVAGTVEMDMAVRFEPGAEATVFADGTIRATRVAVPGFSADSIRLRGTVEGDAMSPVVDVNIRAAGLSLPDYTIDTARIRATGGPERYRLVGTVDSSDGVSANLDVQAQRSIESTGVAGSIGLTQDGETVTTTIRDLQVSDSGAIRLGRARVGYQDARIELSGSYSASGVVSAEVELNEFSLDVLSDLPGVPELPVTGVVSANVTVEGRPDRPEIDLDLSLADASFGPVEWADVGFQLTYASSGASVRSRIDMGEVGRVDLRADAEFPRRLDPVRALRGADYDVALTFDDLNIAALMRPSSDRRSTVDRGDDSVAEVPVEGVVSGALGLTGTIDDPALALTLQVPELDLPGVEPLDVRTGVRYESGELDVEVAASYLDRPLVELGAEMWLPWDADDPAAIVDAIDTSSARLTVRVPERLVRELPLGLEQVAGQPLHVSAVAELAREPGMPPVGTIRLVARAEPEDMLTTAMRCPSIQPLLVAIRLQLADDIARLSVEGTQATWKALTIHTSVDAPLEQWIREGFPQVLPVLDIEADIVDLDLASVPIVCQEVGGLLNGWAQVRGLLTESPTTSVELQGDKVHLPNGVGVHLFAALHTSVDDLQANVMLTSDQGGSAVMTALIPIVQSLNSPIPELGQGAIMARAEFDEFRLTPIATLTPILRRGEGRVSGYLDVGGTIDALDPSGELTLAGLDVSLPGLDQRLSGVSGRVTVSRERLVVQNVRARDHGGTVRVDGSLNLADRDRPVIDIDVVTDAFPVRDAGIIVAYLTASIGVDADLGPERRDATIRLERVAVRLPDESTNTALSIEPNPDIVFIEDLATVVVEEEISQTPRAGPPLHIRVLAADPFWVRRQDFSVQVTIDLNIDVDEHGARIFGELQIRRGWIELLFKSFELREGTITFAGGSDVDPLLEITAVYAPQSDSSEAITVTITGRASDPEIAYSSTVAGVETETEIFQYLLTGRSSDETTEGSSLIESQVASVVSGLTTGLLTQTARRAFGNAAPTLSVRTGDYMRDVAVHAGFDVNRLIPSFLEGIVTGMYVEGYVTTSAGDEEANTQRSTTGGVLLEFYYPRGFSTTGRFQPPANWSLDVMWQP